VPERGQSRLDRAGRDPDRPGREPPRDDHASRRRNRQGSGVDSVLFQASPAGSGTWLDVGSATSTPFTTDFDTAARGDGLYDLRVVATDNAGNTGISAERTNVRVDNTAPSVSLASPGANVSGIVTLDATADDGSGSGVDSVTYEFAAAGSIAW